LRALQQHAVDGDDATNDQDWTDATRNSYLTRPAGPDFENVTLLGDDLAGRRNQLEGIGTSAKSSWPEHRKFAGWAFQPHTSIAGGEADISDEHPARACEPVSG
jgi:hypothetical protein